VNCGNTRFQTCVLVWSGQSSFLPFESELKKSINFRSTCSPCLLAWKTKNKIKKNWRVLCYFHAQQTTKKPRAWSSHDQEKSSKIIFKLQISSLPTKFPLIKYLNPNIYINHNKKVCSIRKYHIKPNFPLHLPFPAKSHQAKFPASTIKIKFKIVGYKSLSGILYRFQQTKISKSHFQLKYIIYARNSASYLKGFWNIYESLPHIKTML